MRAIDVEIVTCARIQRFCGIEIIDRARGCFCARPVAQIAGDFRTRHFGQSQRRHQPVHRRRKIRHGIDHGVVEVEKKGGNVSDEENDKLFGNVHVQDCSEWNTDNDRAGHSYQSDPKSVAYYLEHM